MCALNPPLLQPKGAPGTSGLQVFPPSKLVEHKEFYGLNILKQNYKNKLKRNSNFGKDTITLYKN